jgi:predicted O-methyltransferase YrrM
MDASMLAQAESARGFMPTNEGIALHEAARSLTVDGPLLEVGSYCGKSAVYLGSALVDTQRVLYALDHHRGSEENQEGWEFHEPDLVDPEVGRMDTLGRFRRTIFDAGLEGAVVALVGDSPRIAHNWQTELAMLFIDGGHGAEPARADFELWTPMVRIGGVLAIHDVFEDPADGGRPPYEQIYLPALASGNFTETAAVGSLRILQRAG